MGLTQHKHSVPTLQEVVNLLLIRGMIGKPGAGVCPVRGHSNVQGDRTMGIWELMPESFLAALDAEHGITSPRPHGFDTVATLNAMAAGEIDVFIGMGGNFVSATPDTEATEASMSRVGLTVQISTKPNRSHLVHGTVGLILPTLGRSDRDDAHPGGAQFVTVEDSMSVVHSSRGRLAPVSDRLLAEPVIVCRMARALLGAEHPVDWEAMAADYDVIRDHIARVIPGFENYNERVRVKEGFVLPHPPRDTRSFATASGKAQITVNELSWPQVPEGPIAVADHAISRPVQHHHLRVGRSLPRASPRPAGWCWSARRHRRARPGRPADGRRDQRIRHPDGDRVPAGDQLPGRLLPHHAGLCGRVLPGGECAGADQLGGRRIGHPDVQGRRHPAGGGRRRVGSGPDEFVKRRQRNPLGPLITHGGKRAHLVH